DGPAVSCSSATRVSTTRRTAGRRLDRSWRKSTITSASYSRASASSSRISRSRIARLYDKRGTAEQSIKEGKPATHWKRLPPLPGKRGSAAARRLFGRSSGGSGRYPCPTGWTGGGGRGAGGERGG